MAEINDKDYEEIKRLCADGDKLAETQKYERAIEKYREAYKLIPDPKHDWHATTWVLVAIADACFFLKRFKKVQELLTYTISCPGGYDNPFIRLRLGQADFELGNLDQAAEELTVAYGLEGENIFKREDKKYFEFLKTRIKI